ncbi:MAG TPA: TolC family protein [Novosphingobium sp.]|nr:TolC family protein [Novosphingobium sp.]
MRAPILVLGALALSACKLGPDYARPALPTGAAASLHAGEAPPPLAPWWPALADPRLDALEDEALAHAPTLAEARARVEAARAGLRAARAAQAPAMAVDAAYAHAQLPGQFTTLTGIDRAEAYAAGLDASWEVDLWGARRRAVEQARAGAGLASASLADAEVRLTAELAQTYVALAARQAAATLLEHRAGLEGQLLHMARLRLAGGTGTGQQVEQAAATLDATRADIALNAGEESALQAALAVLAGRAPGAAPAERIAAVPLPPARVEVGDAGALIARRPDVRMAERNLAAAHAGIGMALAQRYPSVSLLGFIGIGGLSAGHGFDSAQAGGLLLPRLTWAFPDFGRVNAAVHAARAEDAAALAHYQAAMLGALQDADGALARFGAARSAYAGALDSEGHAHEAARLEALRAARGTIARSQALAAETQAISATLARQAAAARLTLAYAQLAKALGLGWQGP